ncbi:hypothetical protein BDP27DRAFT_1445699 [Rhodocollybia butyracea]|uniref:Golgi apparatus membrane protein TVP38 n=1 Tax=Rhodocollybia butyracea TaxID=206335 RepID=A0A9P5Q1N0_9AGAR|nr:hypothetical protein BDP27DRAFT_1445699 [Rhodocollybia butyracea]
MPPSMPMPMAQRNGLGAYKQVADSEDDHYYPPQYVVDRNPELAVPPPPGGPQGERWANYSNRPLMHEGGDPRGRTPSPTPSEVDALTSNGMGIRLPPKAFWTTPKGIVTAIVVGLVLVFTILLLVLHNDIIKWLTPFTDWAHDQRFGWLIPVGILIVMSFPPLFGHEIVGLMCGVTWGLGEGFGIVVLGTLLGEIANFATFKYCCGARARKYEQKTISYACLSKLVREGGFKIAVIARFSIIPPHVTTAIFSSAGMSFFTFLAAAIVTLPKQFSTVFLGFLFAQEEKGTETKLEKILNIAVTVVFGVVTYFAMKYISKRTAEVKPEVIYARRKARQAENLKKLSGMGDDV